MAKPYQNVFKNIFEYHTQGIFNDREFCELMDLIYYKRWDESKCNPSKVSENVRIAWQAIEPTIAKSKYMAESYDKRAITSPENGKKGGAPKGNQNARKYEKDDDCGDKDDDGGEIDIDKARELEVFFKDNPTYIENNKSFVEAIQHNGKLNNFCGKSGITRTTGEYVFDKMKSN